MPKEEDISKEEVISRYKYGDLKEQEFLFSKGYTWDIPEDDIINVMLEPVDAEYMKRLQKMYKFLLIPTFHPKGREEGEYNDIEHHFFSLKSGHVRELELTQGGPYGGIDKGIENLLYLKRLDLTIYHKGGAIFQGDFTLPSLEYLSFDYQAPNDFPDILNRFPNLKKLQIKGKHDALVKIDLNHSFLNSKKLEQITLVFVDLEELDDTITALEHLKSLKIYYSTLKTVSSKTLEKLISLETLVLDSNPTLFLAGDVRTLLSKEVKNFKYGGKVIELKVNDAKRRDYGRIFVRIDRQTMERLKIQTGEIIALFGKKLTAGIAWPCYWKDKGLGIIRIDPRMRENTGVAIGDSLNIFKVKTQPAQSIVLAPSNINIKSNQKFEMFVKRKLNNYPVTLGDYIYISIGISREIIFKVVSLKPSGICTINHKTNLNISECS